MKLKYWGAEYEKGLTLTADLYTTEGEPIHTGFTMTETVIDSSAIYATDNIFDTISVMKAGIYVIRIVDAISGCFLGHRELIFNGAKEISLLEIKFMTQPELMQLRDALGIDGDKLIAKDGQLQKKSEGPYNNIVDTNKLI
jgi:hypothetical protein